MRGVRAGSRRLAAPVVVAALGPDTENTLRAWLGPGELGNRPFLDRRPGLLVDIPDTGSFRLVRHVLYTGDNAFHMRPEPAGGIRIGSEDADPPQGEAPDDRKARVLALLARARALIPAIGGGRAPPPHPGHRRGRAPGYAGARMHGTGRSPAGAGG